MKDCPEPNRKNNKENNYQLGTGHPNNFQSVC